MFAVDRGQGRLFGGFLALMIFDCGCCWEWGWIGLLRDGVRWHGRNFDRAEHVEVAFSIEPWHTGGLLHSSVGFPFIFM